MANARKIVKILFNDDFFFIICLSPLCFNKIKPSDKGSVFPISDGYPSQKYNKSLVKRAQLTLPACLPACLPKRSELLHTCQPLSKKNIQHMIFSL